MSTRLEDQRADIIGWFACHNTETIRVVIEAGQAIIAERMETYRDHGCSYCGKPDAVAIGVDEDGEYICQGCALDEPNV